ncbi:MAG: hypothetical protein DRP46_00350 [Candidatus Zixiibacteriota bacterium]|nr:MAG: hypothetical protein DRP46_00350 [candidate division Zixibacteria bacterium]
MDEEKKSKKLSTENSGDIARILIDLMKTIKVVSVYPESNPIPVRMKESFKERFTDIIKEYKKLVFTISAGQIIYGGDVVYDDDSSEDALGEIFHSAGITEISFSEDFDYKEAETFFGAIKSYINKEPGAEDLVALFWQAEIDGFKYATLEDIALREYEGDFLIQESCVDKDAIIKPGSYDDSGKIQYSAIFLDDDEEDDEGMMHEDNHEADNFSAIAGLPVMENLPAGFMPSRKRSSSVSSESAGKGSPLPDTTLILNESFTLEKEELQRVRELIDEDEKFDIFTDTIDLLNEMLYQESEFQDFSEVVVLAEKIQSEFIRQSNLVDAGKIIDCLQEAGKRIKTPDKRFQERINSAIVMSGGWEKLSQFSDALNKDSSIKSEDVIAYLSHFGWESLSTVTDLLGVLEFRHHREAICDFLVQHGREHVDIISKGIFDRRWFVVRNTAAVLARIGTGETAPYLEKAITHPDARVRYQVAVGLCREEGSENINLFFELVWDNDERVRQTAINAILELSGEVGLKTIIKIINDDRFASLAESIQEQMILSLSDLGGEYAVNYLVSLISGRGWFRSQVKDFYQRVAFKALAQNMSEKAEKALLKYNRSWRRRLRRMAGEALRIRREIKYSS